MPHLNKERKRENSHSPPWFLGMGHLHFGFTGLPHAPFPSIIRRRRRASHVIPYVIMFFLSFFFNAKIDPMMMMMIRLLAFAALFNGLHHATWGWPPRAWIGILVDLRRGWVRNMNGINVPVGHTGSRIRLSLLFLHVYHHGARGAIFSPPLPLTSSKSLPIYPSIPLCQTWAVLINGTTKSWEQAIKEQDCSLEKVGARVVSKIDFQGEWSLIDILESRSILKSGDFVATRILLSSVWHVLMDASWARQRHETILNTTITFPKNT